MVRLRGYAQKDPLVEFRKEAFEMFQNLLDQFKYNLARKVFRLEPVAQPKPDNAPQTTEVKGNMANFVPDQSASTPSPETVTLEQSAPTVTTTPVSSSRAPGRNDPCPCGSGKKYKKCCYPQFG